MQRNSIVRAIGNSYFSSKRLSVGCYVKDNLATLIDSGLDEGAAKEINSAIKKHGWTVGAIINTHSHADHCGGNAYFQKIYPDIQIYSTTHEKFYIEEPINEPRCFCKGAAPLTELRNKFLEAPASRVTHPIDRYEDQEIAINGATFTIITLPGHSPGMIGVISPDKVFYTGDAIFGKETLEKHAVLFYTDIEKTLASFKKIATLAVEAVVFYHGGLMEGNLRDVVAEHEARVLKTKASVLDIIVNEPVSMGTLTQRVMQQFNIPENPVQFTLTETCVQAYVTQLELEKEISVKMQDFMLMYAAPSASTATISRAAQIQKVTEAATAPTHEDETPHLTPTRMGLPN